MNTALLLIDLQNDYFPGGKMELEGSPEAGLKAQQLLACFREDELPRVHIQHLSVRPGATFFLPGSAGVQIHALAAPLAGEPVFQKNFPNSFRKTPLLEFLREKQVERLVIAGMMTHMCVDATTRAAFDYEFECWVAQDACATRKLVFQDRPVSAADVQAAFLAALKTSYARVLPTQEILQELRRS